VLGLKGRDTFPSRKKDLPPSVHDHHHHHHHHHRPTPSSALRPRARGALTAALDPHETASFLHAQLPAAVEQSRWLLQALQGVADAAAAAADVAEPATGAAKAAAANSGGWLAAPIGAIEKAISFIHEVRWVVCWDQWMDLLGWGRVDRSAPCAHSLRFPHHAMPLAARRWRAWA